MQVNYETNGRIIHYFGRRGSTTIQCENFTEKPSSYELACDDVDKLKVEIYAFKILCEHVIAFIPISEPI